MSRLTMAAGFECYPVKFRPHNQALVWTGPRREDTFGFIPAFLSASRCRSENTVRYAPGANVTITRRLLNILSAVSLLVLISTMLLWGRSYFVRDEFSAQRSGVQWMWSSDAGRIHFGIFGITPDNGNNYNWTWNGNEAPGMNVPLAGPYWDHEHLGIGWDVPGSLACRIGAVRFQQVAREWWVPYWLMALLSMPVSIILPRRILPSLIVQVRFALEHRRNRARGFPLYP